MYVNEMNLEFSKDLFLQKSLPSVRIALLSISVFVLVNSSL